MGRGKKVLAMIFAAALTAAVFIPETVSAAFGQTVHTMDASANGGAFVAFPQAPPAYRFDTGEPQGRQNVHDPSVIKAGDGYYYLYQTGINIADVEVRRSRDMITWEYVGGAGLMPAARDILQKAPDLANLWAPDVYYANGVYRMYYSCSAGGSKNSCIALAEAVSPAGPFIYKGIVISTSDTGVVNEMNAIDANIVKEEGTGKTYMAYGSFFGGIRIVELNGSTGFVKKFGDTGVLIAKRPAAYDNGSVEGAFIKYRDGYYYLFVSYGNLTNADRGAGGYNVRVGRSSGVTGPYLDHNGRDLKDTSGDGSSVGYKLTGNYRFGSGAGWMAVGHNAVYEENGQWYLAAHARVAGNENSVWLQIRKMYWTDDGWPVISPQLYAGEKVQALKAEYVPGEYERIVFDMGKETSVRTPSVMKLNCDGTADVAGRPGTWSFSGINRVTVRTGSVKETYFMTASWDWDNHRATYTLAGTDDAKTQVWANKIKYYAVSGGAAGSGEDNGIVDSGVYRIKNVNSGLYLDVENGSSANGANIRQWAYNGTEAQEFQLVPDGNGYYKILTGCSGYRQAVDVTDGSAKNGTNAMAYESWDGTPQLFRFVKNADGSYAILTKCSGEKSALEVYGQSAAEGGNVSQWEYLGGKNQHWILENKAGIEENGVYRIKNVNSGLYLDVEDGSSTNGANIRQWTFNGTAAQQFRLVPDKDGFHSILTGCSGYAQAVDVTDGSAENGANAMTYKFWGGEPQLFRFVKNADGSYAILTKCSGEASALEVYEWSADAGGNVSQWKYLGGKNQRWMLEKAE